MFPNLLHSFWLLLQAYTAFSLLIPAVLFLFYFFNRRSQKTGMHCDELHEEKDYAIVIPASGPAEHIQALLQSLLQLEYTNYIIYVAGKWNSELHTVLQNDKVVYLRTAKYYESEVLLQRFIIESFKRPHTHITVIDSDMTVEKDFLTNLNFYFHQGYQAVQCNQVFRNSAGIKSMLHLLTNLYRNFFTGKMMFGLQSSATLSCSGIAFTITFYKKCLKKMRTDNTGFASVIQVQAIDCGQQVAFASRAFVYSHTPQDAHGFAKHHAMRIQAWFFDTFFYSRKVLQGLFGHNKNQLLYGLLSIRIPLPTSICIAAGCLIVNAETSPALAIFWAAMLMVLPVYLLVANKELSKENNPDDELFQDSIAMYSEDVDYNLIAQTV